MGITSMQANDFRCFPDDSVLYLEALKLEHRPFVHETLMIHVRPGSELARHLATAGNTLLCCFLCRAERNGCGVWMDKTGRYITIGISDNEMLGGAEVKTRQCMARAFF